jgi:ATP-dependent helicase/nuclease subunit B
VLAQSVMDGDYELKALTGMGHDARAMLDLIREGDSEPATLDRALAAFAGLLEGGEAFAAHVGQAKATVEQVRGMLAGAAEIEWSALKRAATPKLLTSGEAPDFNREGVTVWREGQEPWRPVRRLIVLGFAQGHYPASLPANPVLSAEDLRAIRDAVGLPVATPTDELARRRERFRRQLGAASESVSLLVPRRNSAGDTQTASESLVFMHQLFAGTEEAAGLVAELDAADERERVRHLAMAAPAAPRPPRAIEVEDLEFGRDLLELRVDAQGKPKPESPSSLETLMVSGLGWLLKRLEAEPVQWAPEEAGPLVLGSLAHEVFEGLFVAGQPLPSREEILERVDALIEEAFRTLAPFLRGSQWKVERQNFSALTTKAALAWRDALEALGAEVLAAEEWLAGEWGGIAIHGQTDLVLGLPGNRLLVVDYKRSKSGKRLTQMQKGFDSQASLYRAMIATGGPKNPQRAELGARLKAASATGVVYYLLNDQKVLSDAAFPETAAVPGWRTLGNDIAAEALALIGQRIEGIRAGRIRLNRAGDREFFEKKAGVTPYALEVSPLITLFSLPEEDEEGEES